MRPLRLATALTLVVAGACGDNEPLDAEDPTQQPDDAEPVDCANLAPGPFPAIEFVDGLGAAEDIAFDGVRGFVAAGTNGLTLVGPDGTKSPFETDRAVAFPAGLRFGPDGALYALEYLAGRLVRVDNGAVTELRDNLQAPNAVYAASDGRIYFTETDGNRVAVWAPKDGADELITLAEAGPIEAPNGVTVDERHGRVYVANGLGKSTMTIVRLDAKGTGQPVEIYGGPGSADGIALGECGHLYLIDNDRGEDNTQPRRLRRLRLDADGNAVGEPETLAEFERSATNAVFGGAPGFDARSMYVTGFEGVVYRVDTGVGSLAPMPTADRD